MLVSYILLKLFGRKTISSSINSLLCTIEKKRYNICCFSIFINEEGKEIHEEMLGLFISFLKC